VWNVGSIEYLGKLDEEEDAESSLMYLGLSYCM